MQTAVSDPKLRTKSSARLAESAASSRVNSRAAASSAFTHKRGRKRLNMFWEFKLVVIFSVSALVAVSLLLQA